MAPLTEKWNPVVDRIQCSVHVEIGQNKKHSVHFSRERGTVQ